MKEECLICGAPLTYLTKDEEMECAICYKVERSKTRCVNGHYVCNDCHTDGIESIRDICLRSTGTNPIAILREMMAQPFCHMHGPEHHILVGSALLAAYHNAGGAIDLGEALDEMARRGREIPGGACGFWGACGAGVSAGIYIAIITESTPLAKEAWGQANRMTSKALEAIGSVGGPRCCKRDSYLAIESAIDFTAEQLGISLEKTPITCIHRKQNNQCIGKRCPYNVAVKDFKHVVVFED